MNEMPEEKQAALGRWLDRVLGIPAAIVLFMMMVLTCVDVVGRYVFGSPVKGVYEITELSLATLVLVGFPLVTYRREHITTALFDNVLSGRARQFKEITVSLASAFACAILAWRMWIQADQIRQLGQHSQTLNIPIAPLAYVLSISGAASCIILVLQAADAWQRPHLPRKTSL